MSTPRISMVKRPSWRQGAEVEYLTDAGNWARATVRQTSATGNVWLRTADDDGGWLVAAIPTEVRAYR